MTTENTSAETQTPPAYSNPSDKSSNEKGFINTTEPSTTPLLDAYLSNPAVRDHIQTLSLSLSDVAEGRKSTRSALQSAVMAFSELARDAKQAKKEARWSKAEAKALKAELKGVMKEIKPEVKKVWKERERA